MDADVRDTSDENDGWEIIAYDESNMVTRTRTGNITDGDRLFFMLYPKEECNFADVGFFVYSEKKVEDTISKAKNLEGRILNEKDGHNMFQIWGDSLDIDNLLASMNDEEFLEVTRSGLLGMTKGSIALNTNDLTKISK